MSHLLIYLDFNCLHNKTLMDIELLIHSYPSAKYLLWDVSFNFHQTSRYYYYYYVTSREITKLAYFSHRAPNTVYHNIGYRFLGLNFPSQSVWFMTYLYWWTVQEFNLISIHSHNNALFFHHLLNTIRGPVYLKTVDLATKL